MTCGSTPMQPLLHGGWTLDKVRLVEGSVARRKLNLLVIGETLKGCLESKQPPSITTEQAIKLCRSETPGRHVSVQLPWVSVPSSTPGPTCCVSRVFVCTSAGLDDSSSSRRASYRGWSPPARSIRCDGVRDQLDGMAFNSS